MAHLALYRKYRSRTFDDLVGQEHVTKTLQNAVESGRIAHAYLFVGPRGTGKTSTARILARSLNCEHGPTAAPCGECSLCIAITAGNGGDVIELDAASESGVDEVRDIIESAKYSPLEGRYKVFVIDEVHDLSSKAFDALLKTIEEPPAHVVFVLATTEVNRVPLTIRSRCQRYEFHRGSLSDIIGRLEFVCKSEGIEFEPAALSAIARMADGGYRDALTLLEQALLASEGKLTYDAVMQQLGMIGEEQTDKMLSAALAGDMGEVLASADEAIRSGKEPRAILEALLLRLSELTHALVEIGGNGDPERHAAAHALATRIGRAELLRFRSELAEAHKEIRDVSLPRLWLELALMKLSGGAPAPNPRQAEPEKPKPKPAPPPRVQTGEGGDIASKWLETVARLGESKPGTGKALQSTFVARVDGKHVYIAFAHRMQLDRVQNNEAGKKLIVKSFHETVGDDSWILRFELDPAAADREAAAVQSVAEGDRLAEIVEQVFEVKPEQI